MILTAVIIIIVFVLAIQYVQLQRELAEAKQRLNSYQSQNIALSYGEMTYVDKGTGPVILVAHGISGGYDQGYEALHGKEEQYRILAPSRFGYLGSTVPGNASPKAQAAAYKELLDALGIEKVFLLGTSAGGTIAIRFALDYPDRTQGLILYSSAFPLPEKPESYSNYQGPPAFLCNDFAMWLFRPLFKPMMGMKPNTIYGMLPVSKRKEGMQIDAATVNPDMARNFDQYPIEEMNVPALIVGARDDKLANFDTMEQAISRFRYYTLLAFDTGGHMMEGHEQEIDTAFDTFIQASVLLESDR
ncbi:alpha/beta fold hydrolase [Paenibacillus brevis]|uniref:Alpha/beta hydrolase n=1 Tax=Paenibacillus brevis TaxID=2841508 RepID=A0ABS6FSH1_9BACL|nr:alpha/beta hydrolase [Paenibacillus brevis]MBU5673176.1 alpha/beta hydrolase [Paenibacillus brevis]